MTRSRFGDFTGTERFRLEEHLGTGTSGEVFRAYDTKHDSLVALKTLHRADPAAIYRFKNEFRALADVSHPNLVQLYELLSDGERWFFTMELIEGCDFLEYCRGMVVSDPASPPSSPADLDRLRAAARQLAEGLAALHDAGKLHCDIKPPNIRVDRQGRLVLLDFGLAQELFPSQGELTIDGELAGTPAYMSPEQAAGGRLDTASDWYSAGVVIFEALTGRRPFEGSFLEVLQKKQSGDAPSPKELLPDLPADLASLTTRLLRHDPGRRPSAGSVLRQLGRRSRRALASHRSTSGTGAPFIGRQEHLAALSKGFAQSRQGQAVLFFVHGSSGMGKSALIHQFLRKVRHEHDETVVLSGRCYERESVPYKALDALIDGLTHHLIRLPKGEIEALLPSDIQALARLFPSLRRLQAVARAGRQVLDLPDERELKRRARTALRELFTNLAARSPLVLYIDDLQWGDRDSADLLTEILRPPTPPPIFLASCFRSEERDTSPLLRRLLSSDLIAESTVMHQLAVDELPTERARDLALQLLGDASPAARTLAKTIARESHGSPYFVAEMARYARHHAVDDDGGSGALPDRDQSGMTLERLILTRLEELTPPSTRLLELVAVAGQPVALQVVLQAGELGSAAQTAVTLLRGSSLIRVRRSRAFDEIECYHDRIREAVIGVLDRASRRRHHGALGLALEATGHADPETLAFHFHEAGDRERQAHFVTVAADQATEALAFDRAARLYRSALELEQYSRLTRRELLVKLGDALTNAGRGAEAARAYLEAAPGARTAEALELRRRAAEQQLISGHIDEGLSTLRQVLASIDMKMPTGRAAVLASLLLQRLKLKFRGLSYRERDSSQLSPDQLIRIDTCRSVAIGLSNVYPIRGMDFATRHLLLALAAGEPFRVARALALEAGFSSVDGTGARKRTSALLRAALTLAERVNEPSAIALAHVSTATAAYLEGDGARAWELFDRAEAMLRNTCTGVTWELDTLLLYKFRLLTFLGELDVLFRQVPPALQDVMERGDIYAESGLRSNVVWLLKLAGGHPEEALEEIRLAADRWSQEGFHLNHYLHFLGRVEIALYRGDGGALPLVEATWPALVGSQLLRVQVTRTEAWHLRCRAALAAATEASRGVSASAKILDQVTAPLRRLDKQKHPWARAFTHLVRAGIDSLRSEPQAAIDHLATAAAGFDAARMKLYAAATRRRRGQLLGPRDGARLISECDEWMHSQGITEPQRFADVLVPGRWDPQSRLTRLADRGRRVTA
ncbi:MAG: protein kinase [Acidobacteriota bacterium]